MISSSLMAVFFNFFAPEPATISNLPLLKWHEAAIFELPTQPDPKVEAMVEDYLQDLSSQGLSINRQGVWIQSDWAELGDNQGKIPASAASLTKIATSLAAIDTWDVNHQFSTKIYVTGEVKAGVLEGDLVIEGSGDPLFVWEEAIALGNTLNELGIRQVKGNLTIVGDFYMNFQQKISISAHSLKKALDYRQWSSTVKQQYQTLFPQPLRPQIEVTGKILLQNQLPQQSKLLVTHQSLTLAEILKLMNVYSNNKIAEILADKIGGGQKVAQIAAKLAKVPQAEIQLINGSGLGVNNLISPHAACKMLMALEQQLEKKSMTIADVFPVADIDLGTIKNRNIPPGIAVKTGTLATVSALAGVIPTKERDQVWFAIINYGSDLKKLRAKQDKLLQNLKEHWHIEFSPPKSQNNSYFGDPTRNFI